MLVLQTVRPAQIPLLVQSARQDSTYLTMLVLAARLIVALVIKKTLGILVIHAFLTTALIMIHVKLVAVITHLIVQLHRAAINGLIAIIAMDLVLLALINIAMIVIPAMKAHPTIHLHQHVKEYHYLNAIKQHIVHQLSLVSHAILVSPSRHL